jgi:hypothetical protein
MTNRHLLQAAAVCYTLSVFGYLSRLILKKDWLQHSALTLVLGGFLLPSAGLAWRCAAADGALMTGGIVIALFSFYRKRARLDRPEV